MKKNILGLFVMLTVFCTYSQKDKELTLNEETGLIKAVYYHENGVVSQEGTFNLDRKLHGEWVSYNEDGIKIAQGSYEKGLRTGTWVFWSDSTMKKVEYSKNTIASINGVKSKRQLVDNHK